MRGIGFFLGATLGAAILFYIISFIFLRPRTVKKTEIDDFMQNSKSEVIVQPIPFWSEYKGDDDRLGSIHFNKMTFFSNKSMSYVRAVTYTFYSNDLKKYVRTYTISEGGGLNSILLEFGDDEKDVNKYPDMIFYYNKTQNADPTFGTIDKPLPILHFRSSNPALRSMRSNNKDADPDYLKEVYEENVKLYLEYFIDKEDFKKLFPES